MRFLISNYASESQTECFYLNAGLSLINGINSTLWDNTSISAYDVFDMAKPDYFITHINNIFTDAISYIQNENKDIRMIINTTGTTSDYVLKMEKMLIDEGVSVAFFFSNCDDDVIKLKKNNMLSINLGADVFLNNGEIVYNIDKAFLVNRKIDIKLENTSYHTISYHKACSEYVDIVLPVTKLSEVYKNYNEFIFKDYGTFLPQIFFDAIYYGNKVYYDIDDNEKMELVNNKIKKLFRIDHTLLDNSDPLKIKSIVKSRHTCLHRLKTLLSQLPANEYVVKLDDFIKLYSGENK